MRGLIIPGLWVGMSIVSAGAGRLPAAEGAGPAGTSLLTALQNGDSNGDWEVNLADGVHLLNFLYLGGPPPVAYECGTETPTTQNGDVNGDRTIDLSDAVWLLSHLFAGGPPPAAIECSTGFGEGGSRSAYVFKVLSRLGNPAPGGGTLVNDFEPYGLNNSGEVSFGADLSTGGEGVFTGRNGRIIELARTGGTDPAGNTFDFGFLGRTPINDAGEVAFIFALSPFAFPVGSNAGLYRYSSRTRAVSAVVLPGVTPAPSGGVFAGLFYDAVLNNLGDLVFTGIVPGADIGAGPPGIDGSGLGFAVYRADRSGSISTVLFPGDAAPGGGTFDWFWHGYHNDAGDIGFGAHVAGEECIDFGTPQDVIIFCAESVYLRKASGEIVSVAHQGQAAPGGGTYRLAFGPVLNARGDAVFIGDLTPAPGSGDALGVFLFRKGTTTPVARPGDAMPGGGHMARAAFNPGNYHLNNAREVAFNATLDTDANGDGAPDGGLYVSSRGSLFLVVRTGTVIPGVGTVAHLQPPALVGSPVPHSGVVLNDRKQIFFQVTLTDGSCVLLLAIPRSREEGDFEDSSD